MAKLPILADVVKAILTAYPDTRDSDGALYVAYCNWKKPATKDMSFNDVMLKYKELGLASYDSVGRVRRKIQENDETLRAKKEVIDIRFEQYKDIKEWALSE